MTGFVVQGQIILTPEVSKQSGRYTSGVHNNF